MRLERTAGDKDCEYGKWIPLYSEQDIEPDNNHDEYISKSSLRLNYFLSEGWIKKISEPDKLVENPQSRYYTPMKLYSRKRVEAFLVQNAKQYAEWLIKRGKNKEVYEANKEAIQSGAVRYRERQRLVKEQEAVIKYNRPLFRFVSTFKDENVDNAMIANKIMNCLNCASGCAYERGFLCAIYPGGLTNIPCPEYKNRVQL